MKVLVVWSQIPDRIAQFIKLDIDEDTLGDLVYFDQHYINGDDRKMSERILNFFYSKNGEHKYPKTIDVNNEHYDAIIRTGIYV